MISHRISFPSLEESGTFRYIIFAALYFAQGVPEGILFFALPAWFAMHDVSALAIGNFVAVALLPWTLKLIDGPLMADYHIFQGEEKTLDTVRTGRSLSKLNCISLVKDPVSNLVLVTLLGFLTYFFSAFQNVATEKMTIDIFHIDQQARANDIMR